MLFSRLIKIKNIKLSILTSLLSVLPFVVFAQEITAIDFNGDILGKVIPDGKVISMENEIVGNINADSFVLNEDGDLIGGVVPQGIAIGNDNKVLGKVNNDGSIRLSSGKIAGKALPNGLVVDENYNIIGAVLFPGLVYSDFGKTIGRLTGDGNYTNLDGQIIGFMSADGYAYKKSGDEYVVDGRLLSSKMVISQNGKFIGSVALGGRVTDFESNIIGNIHANGYAYDEEDNVIGRIVKNGYAISEKGDYLGFVSYNGDVIKNNQVIGHMRFDENIVDDKQNVIGYFVDIASSFTDLNGTYLGRIMPEGKIARAKEESGSVFARGNVVDGEGKIIGKEIKSGPVFDYRAKLVAYALKNGQALSFEGSPLGKIIGNNVFSNVGRILGATFKNLLIVDKNNKALGINGISGYLSGVDRSYVSPFGYVYSSDGVINAYAIPLGPIYDLYGSIFGYVSPNAEVLNKEYVKMSGVTQFGFAQNDEKQITGKYINVDYAINRNGDIFDTISQNNLILNKVKAAIAKILPDMSVVATADNDAKKIAPKVGSAYYSKIVLNKEGNFVGYARESGEVYDTEGSLIGKVADRGFVLDGTGILLGEIVETGIVVDDKCGFIGVVTPRGDVRNYKDSVIGKILQNGQVVSEGGAVVGFVVKENLLINRKNEVAATPSVNGFAYGLNNTKIGCVDIRGYYTDADEHVVMGTLDYKPVMSKDSRIIGRSVFDGSVVDEDGMVLGRVSIDESAVDANGKVLGRLFKYRYAFDNDNNYLGRVLESARVVNNNNEDVGIVSTEGYVLDKGEKIGYAAYDMYIYNDEGKAIGYIDKNSIVKSFSGNKIGNLNKGFVINENDKLIGRINRDFWVSNDENKIVGELRIDGKLYSLDGELLGKVDRTGKVKNSKGKVIATPNPLQYYLPSKKIKQEPEEVGEITVGSKISDDELKGFSSEIVGIALTPDGDYLGNIMSNGDVVDKNGNIVGQKMDGGLIVDKNGNVIGVEDVKRPAGQGIFVPAGTFGNGGAYGIGGGVGNLGPGGGYGPGERYNAQRAAALQQAQDARRSQMGVGKISTTISKSSFDGYQKDWSEQGISKNISSWRVDMSLMILADKPIPAVLARAIDTSNAAPATAFVERNVYSEEGRNVVIPAGSRLIGEYTSGSGESGEANSSAARQNITWKRLIRPDGSMFTFTSASSADPMGRAGVLAYVDKQLLKKYTGPLLTALLSETPSLIFSTNESPSVENTETGRQQTMSDIRQDFNEKSSDVFKQLMQDLSDVQTIVYIPAGTRMIIYPNEDLWLRTFENDQDGTVDLQKPGMLIDDKKNLSQIKENEISKTKGSGSSDNSNARYDDVVYQENGTNAQSQGSMKLIDDSKNNKNNTGTYYGTSGGIPPVTVDPVAPPPTYRGDLSDSNTKSNGSTPQLF